MTDAPPTTSADTPTNPSPVPPDTTEPEYMTTAVLHPDVMTLPSASIRLGVSLDRLRELLRKDADLAAKIGKVGGRWCIDAVGLELIRKAVTDGTR